jgi:hypothetical protein
MGLLDPQIDPLSLGLLQASAGLLAPRRQGGGIAGGIAGFGRGLLEGEELLRARAAQANRDRLTNAQIANFESDADYRKGLLAERQAAAQRQAQSDAAAQEQAMAQLAARSEFADAYQRAGGQWSPTLAMLGMRAGIKGEDLERLAKGQNLGREKLTWQNGLGLDPFTGQPRATAPDVNQPFFPTLVDGRVGAAPNSAVQNFEIGKAKAGATNVSTVFPKQMAAVDAKIAEGDMGKWESARAARNSLRSLMESSPGALQGPAANLAVTGIDFMSSLGIAGPELEKLSANTAGFNSQATELILANIKKLGANPSNADLNEIKKLVPQVTQSKAARDKVAQIMLKYTNRAELDAKHRFNYIQSKQGSAGWSPLKVNDMPDDPKKLMPGALYQHPGTQAIAVYRGNGEFETVAGDD